MRFYNFVTPELPQAAIIDLDQVVGIKPNGPQDRLIVQFDGARGLMLPFDASARDALIAAWSEGRSVFAYKFSDPDRDDAMTTCAWVRADKVKAVAQHHLDPAFLQIRTSAPSGMIVPFNAGAVRELSQAIAG